MNPKIFKLFPYSSEAYDPQESLKDVLKSIKNLNTRLLNLKKINKSLKSFVDVSNQSNWSDLQKINLEIVDED